MGDFFGKGMELIVILFATCTLGVSEEFGIIVIFLIMLSLIFLHIIFLKKLDI